MTQVKYSALRFPQKPLDKALNNTRQLFELFSRNGGIPVSGSKAGNDSWKPGFTGINESIATFGSEVMLRLTDLTGQHKIIIDIAQTHRFSHVRTLARQISGIANTMRNEYILLLKKNNPNQGTKIIDIEKASGNG